jgi:hypothetical protein
MNNERYKIQLRKNSAPAVILNVAADSYEGTEDSSVTIRQNTDTGLAFSYGNSITFFNDAFALIVDELANSPTAAQNSIEIYIYDTCCKDRNGNDYLIFKGLIRSSDIEITIKPDSERCGVECDFTDYSQTSEAITCLKQTVIFSNNANGRTSNGENEGRAAVYYSYYEETRPRAYMYFLLYLGAYLVVMATIVLNILTVGLINLGGELREIKEDIKSLFIKKRFHKAPFISSYLRNICKLCGLQLQSTIFSTGGFWENINRLDAAIQEGGEHTAEADIIFKDFNAPNITGTDLLDSLKQFNIGYWLQNGNTLVVERKDYQTATWIDFATRDFDRLSFKFGDETPPATRVYEYINDLSDKTGQEFFRGICGYAIDYNTPINPAFRGSEKITFPYGTWRTINDSQQSVLLRASNTPPLSLVYNNISQRSLLMQTGTCGSPKLLEYDTSSPVIDATMFNNNRRLYIDASGTLAAQDRVYVQFLQIDDPRITGIKNKDFELVFSYECEDLRTFEFNKTVRIPLQNGNYKDGVIDNLTINFKDGTITINGKV